MIFWRVDFTRQHPLSPRFHEQARMPRTLMKWLEVRQIVVAVTLMACAGTDPYVTATDFRFAYEEQGRSEVRAAIDQMDQATLLRTIQWGFANREHAHGTDVITYALARLNEERYLRQLVHWAQNTEGAVDTIIVGHARYLFQSLRSTKSIATMLKESKLHESACDERPFDSETIISQLGTDLKHAKETYPAPFPTITNPLAIAELLKLRVCYAEVLILHLTDVETLRELALNRDRKVSVLAQFVAISKLLSKPSQADLYLAEALAQSPVDARVRTVATRVIRNQGLLQSILRDPKSSAAQACVAADRINDTSRIAAVASKIADPVGRTCAIRRIKDEARLKELLLTSKEASEAAAAASGIHDITWLRETRAKAFDWTRHAIDIRLALLAPALGGRGPLSFEMTGTLVEQQYGGGQVWINYERLLVNVYAESQLVCGVVFSGQVPDKVTTAYLGYSGKYPAQVNADELIECVSKAMKRPEGAR